MMAVPLDCTALDAVIIDLDGTMVDTLGDFAQALNLMLDDVALPHIDPPAIAHMVGKGSEHLLNLVLNHALAQAGRALSAIEIEALYARAWPSYQRHYLRINGQWADHLLFALLSLLLCFNLLSSVILFLSFLFDFFDRFNFVFIPT